MIYVFYQETKDGDIIYAYVNEQMKIIRVLDNK